MAGVLLRKTLALEDVAEVSLAVRAYDFDPAAELGACLDQLALAGRRERIDFLIEKQKLSPLTDEEKSELRHLH